MQLPLVFIFASLTAAIQLTVTDLNNVKSVTSSLTWNLMTIYQGNQSGQIPGLLPGGMNCNPNNPGIYCWWEAGGMFGALINYWQYTGDTTYNSLIMQAIAHQRGADSNFNPANQSKSMGIDDQGFWGFTAMDAVESNFPEVGGDVPSYLSMAQALYNFQLDKWDTATCGGGFRWQVFRANGGYNLKNTVSNGANFQLAARLAYVTGNTSYSDWANKVYDWMESSKLYEYDNKTSVLYIWDNTDANNNCTDQENYVWSYNYGIMLAGAAYMYNYTNGEQIWLDRVNTILTSTFFLFFPKDKGGNILVELQCEDKSPGEPGYCNQDQKSFKTFMSRWLAVTAQLVPSTAAQILPKLAGSAVAAANQCSGGDNGHWCGLKWPQQNWDGTQGVGQQVRYRIEVVLC